VERQLFPGVVCVVLAVVALWPPWTAVRLGYVLAAALAFDASLGVHGLTFPLLREASGAFRGLRVPSRFSILVGLSLAVLAGHAVVRILDRWPAWRRPLFALLLGLVVLDPWPRLQLVPAWREPPSIYGAIPSGSPAILAEFPVTNARGDTFGARYIYFSTFHWNRLINGNSGFLPPSWHEFVERTTDFPSGASLAYLRSRGVQYIAVHGGFYADPEEFAAIQRTLANRDDLTRVATARFNGSQSELYRLDP
jgi:hypothetical protein